MAADKLIWVTFRKEGLHKYPAALTDPKLATGGADDVSFLGFVHRHIFHFKVSIEVFSDDRDIEFIQFKRWLESLYGEGRFMLNFKSCEMISDDLYEHICTKYPGREVIIEIAEDGENGSYSRYPVVRKEGFKWDDSTFQWDTPGVHWDIDPSSDTTNKIN